MHQHPCPCPNPGTTDAVLERTSSQEQAWSANERLEWVARATNDIVWDWDLTANRLWWSEGMQTLFGYSAEEIEPGVESWHNRIHPDDKWRVIAGLRTALGAGGSAWSDEYRFQRRDGSHAHLYDRGVVIRDGHGKAVRMVGAMMDITARKQAEEALARHAARQETVAALGQFALGHGELNELMTKAASEVARGLGVEYCKIQQYAAEENCLLLRARTGWDTTHPGRVPLHGDRESIESQCLLLQEAITVEDFRHGAPLAPGPSEIEAQVLSGIAVVINGDQDIYGVLSAHATRPRRFTADEIGFVQAVANVLAAAVEREATERRLAHLAQFDPLTGLPNRHLFRDRLMRAVTRAQRDERMVALLFIDLDQFKQINDTLGHGAGDQVLKNVGRRLRGSLRADDTIARLGGDEFTVILEDMKTSAEIQRVAEKILHLFGKPIRVDGKELFVTPSIGIAMYPFDGKDGDSLLKHADVAMYQAKNEGRNNIQFYAAAMSAVADDRMNLEHSLRHALEQQELVLHYQPIVDLKTGRIISVEALLRWQHPEWGLAAPAQFLPLAERTGLIVPIGEWVLHEVCAQAAVWQRAGAPALPVAVNLSARQFRSPSLRETIERALTHAGLGGHLLELEISESVLMENPESSGRLLEHLKTTGASIVLDDFGTGYSSFSHLKHFPLEAVKIDQSFVRDLASDPDDAAIVTGMIELGHSLHLKLTAEGTETQAQVEFLRKHGCDRAEGYLFGRPRSAAEMMEVLRGREFLIG